MGQGGEHPSHEAPPLPFPAPPRHRCCVYHLAAARATDVACCCVRRRRRRHSLNIWRHASNISVQYPAYKVLHTARLRPVYRWVIIFKTDSHIMWNMVYFICHTFYY